MGRTVLGATQLKLAMALVVLVVIGAITAVRVSAAPPAITTCQELQTIDSNITYVLSNNIDCGATAGWNGGAGFEPLGTGRTDFQASIDGNGYTVSNVYINRPTTDNVGLYARAKGVNITNIRFDDLVVTGRNNVGGLAGEFTDATIDNVEVRATIRGNAQTGGLIGVMSSGTINKVITDGTVNGTGHTGGIVGSAVANAPSTNAPTNLANIATVTNAINAAAVSANGQTSAAGGIIGHAAGLTVQYALSTADVAADISTGGIIGSAADGSRLEHVVSVGSITNADSNHGGIAGSVDRAAVINNAYWSIAETGQSTAAGLNLGAITSDTVAAKTSFYNTTGQAPLNAWNFSSVWQTWPDSLPLLRGFDYLSITAGTLANGQANTNYPTQLITTSQAHGPVAFRISNGTLPPGLTFDGSSGTLRGTPTTAGSYNFSITARDRLVAETQEYNLVIAPALAPSSPSGDNGNAAPATPVQYAPPTSRDQAANTVQLASGSQPRTTYSAKTLQPSVPPAATTTATTRMGTSQPAVLGQQTQAGPAIIDAQHIYEASLPSFSSQLTAFIVSWWLPVVVIVAFTAYSLFHRRWPVPALQSTFQTNQQDQQTAQLQQLIERAQTASLNDSPDRDQENHYL